MAKRRNGPLADLHMWAQRPPVTFFFFCTSKETGNRAITEKTEWGEKREKSALSWLLQVSNNIDGMLVLPGISWVFLSALLHAVAPWGADRPGRPRQCDAPKSVSRVGRAFLSQWLSVCTGMDAYLKVNNNLGYSKQRFGPDKVVI